MARVLVTGARAGLGLGTARELAGQGHDVLVHARSDRHLDDLADVLARGAQLVVADLADLDQVRDLAEQVDELGGVDAVVHNAGTMDDEILVPVNVVAPYALTALVPARRLVYLSSSMHTGGRPTLAGLDPSAAGSATYSDSKLLVTVLAAAAARLLPGVAAHAVDPGWVPTAMGGAGAPDDLELGHRTQAWLAAGEDPETRASGYWHHQRRRTPHPSVHDEGFQDDLLAALQQRTGLALPR